MTRCGPVSRAASRGGRDWVLRDSSIPTATTSGDEFRTAPLWGLGQRIYFLHDGRPSDLLEAIAAHQSRESEANSVIRNFNDLSEAQKQDVLNFLRSL